MAEIGGKGFVGFSRSGGQFRVEGSGARIQASPSSRQFLPIGNLPDQDAITVLFPTPAFVVPDSPCVFHAANKIPQLPICYVLSRNCAFPSLVEKTQFRQNGRDVKLGNDEVQFHISFFGSSSLRLHSGNTFTVPESVRRSQLAWRSNSAPKKRGREIEFADPSKEKRALLVGRFFCAVFLGAEYRSCSF